VGKYDPLARHLRRQKTPIYEMSFRDIERVLGALLPRRAQDPAWWASGVAGEPPSVQARSWSDAGFEATRLPGNERVRFNRRP